MTGNHPQFEHDRYEELCALATAGALTTEETETLFHHLDECAECSEMFAQYESIATQGMPLLADRYASVPETTEFDVEPALARLLESTKDLKPEVMPVLARSSQWINQPAWRGLIAASLIAGVAFASYKAGERRHSISTPVLTGNTAQKVDTQAEQHILEVALQAERQREAGLESLLATRNTDTEKLRTEAKEVQERLDDLTTSLTTSKADASVQIASLTEQRDSSAAKLRDAMQSYQTVQDELNTLRSQHKQDLLHLASLDDKVNGLTVALNDQDRRAKNDEQYLSSDKDIRDLIGARNLYIADIMDVREDGTARKPFGRVFYTKTKSLVFYAYDLDRQPGVKQASTFQVWGRTGANDSRPVNLGVLYMDSETNRRWALKVNDPQQLAQLDAIFVTVEPHGQSEKPTGKPFLYASLRRDANHP
ncbi:MAG: hypothetical protein WDN23_01590 [Edaphobacter sp.]